MPRIIYLGLQAFANTPQLLLPSAQNPLVCDALPESSLQVPETQVLMLPELDSLGARHLGHWLKQSTENHLLIAWPQPQPWLAACLATGRGVEEVLASWHQQAECLLALFRSARRQVGLVGYAPGATLKTLEAPEVAESVAPVYQLAAAQLIGQHGDVLETCDYLFASSIEHQALPHNAQALASSALEEYEQLLQTDIQCKANQQQISVLQAEKAQLTEQANSAASDQNALLEQLMAVQEALENKVLEIKAQAEALDEKESKLTWLRNKTQKQEEALEKNRQQLAKQQPDLQKAEAQIEQLAQEKSHLQGQLKSTESENTLLLEQLMTVQEALEEQALKSHEQDATQHRQMLEEEQVEKALIVEQLHKTQEQLIKATEGYAHDKKQADKRQKKINMLTQQHQRETHQYKSVMQWLRAWGYRHASEAYRHSKAFKRALPQQVAILNGSDFFDAQWYCEQYPDVESSGMTPAAHYLKFGAMEGRNPSTKFDTCFYLSEYTDVAESGQNPLLHYLRHGQFEERLPIKQQQQLPAPL